MLPTRLLNNSSSTISGYLCIALTVLSVSGCADRSKEALYAGGMEELKKSNPNGAIVYFKNALEKDKNYYAAQFELAKAFRKAGRFELSEIEFAKLLAHPPVSPDLKLELVKLHLADKKYDQAIKELGEYAQAHGASSEYYELSGVAYASKNNPGQAITFLVQSLKAEPARVSTKLELASVYLFFHVSDKRAEARRLIDEVLHSQPQNVRARYLLVDLEAAAGNRDAVINLYSKISELDGADFVAPYRLGLLYLNRGDLGKAEQIAAQLLKKYPNRAESITLSGIIAVQKKQFPEAVASLQKGIKIQSSGEAYFYLGLSHYSLGAFELALSQLNLIAENNLFSQPAKTLKAQIYLNQRRVDDAISESRKLLAVNPSHPLAHNILGSAYLAKGMNDEGIRELKRAIELDPKNTESYLKKGMANLIKGRSKEAETDFISATHVAPELVNARLILSGFYQQRKEYAKAVTTLEQGITGKKGDAVLYGKIADVMFAQNKAEEGLKYLQKAKQADPEYLDASFNIAMYYSVVNQPEKALQEYREIVGKKPANVRALLGMAGILEISGKDGDAKDCYQKAVKTGEGPAYTAMATYWMRKEKADKALSVLNDGIKAVAKNLDAMRLKVQILATQKKYTEALKVCEDMELIDPQQGLQYKVNIFLQQNDYRRAIEEASRYVTLHPATAFGHMVMADIYDSRNDQASAIKVIKEGIGVEGGNLAALVKLGDQYAKKGDLKGAMESYRVATRKNPEFVPAIFAQGVLMEKMGKKKEAIDKYREILNKSERYVPALNNLAYLYINDTGNLQEGLRMAYRAFMLEPSNPSILDTFGLALLKNKQNVVALQVLEKATSMAPKNADITYHLAMAYQENGNREKAVQNLQKSLSLGDFPDAGNARKLLEKQK